MLTAKRLACLAITGLLLGGCQLLAGVHGDAQLISTTGSGGAGGGSTTTGSTGGSTGNGGSGGGCQGPADCPGGACLDGSCVKPLCQLDHNPFDIFTEADVTGQGIDPYSLLVFPSPPRLHVAVRTATTGRLVARTLPTGSSGQGGPIADFDIVNGGSIVSGRSTPTSVVFQGRIADEIGELAFPRDSGGILPGGVWTPFPTLSPECTSPKTAERMVFAVDGAATRYAANCGMPGQPAETIVVGGSDVPTPIVIAQNMNNDDSLNVQFYAITGGTRLFIHGDNDGGTSFFRTGTTDADLATASVLSFDSGADQHSLVIGVIPLPTADGVSLLGAQFTPAPKLSGAIWGGMVKDYSTLSQVPPPSLKKSIPDLDPSQIGDPGILIGDASGLYWPMAPKDGKHVGVSWFGVTGEILVFNQEVFAVPAGDSAQILRVQMGKSGDGVVLVWVEDKAGVHTVRGQRLLCTY